ncbi:MAG TPA: FHA domain-containing protein [Actinomycetota bacterium]|nr:FHA domain-containing protein [Actinomycetota bacterium]
MPILVLDLLKYVFLAVLYIFVARAVRAVWVELRPAGARPQRSRSAPAPTPSRPPSKKAKAARRLAVVEGDSHKGKTFDVADELTIGRSDKCHIVLDDTYVSQMHARIFGKEDGVVVEDLGSTNGTYVNRRRITSPTPVARGDRVKIGRTVLELRK